MSLTRLIKNHPELKREFPNLKGFLTDQNDMMIKLSERNFPIKVPSLGKSFECSLIGTAFDYAARGIILKYFGRDNVTREKVLAAEYGLRGFQRAAESMEFSPTGNDDIDKERNTGLNIIWNPQENELIKQYLSDRFEKVMHSREIFIDGNSDLKTMIEGSIFLARLDEVYRNRAIQIADEYFLEKTGKTYFSQYKTLSNADMIEQVYSLCLIFESFLHTTRWKKAILGPVFAEYSQKVGGADADLIVDDILIDLKSRNKLSYRGDDFAQVFGYAAMAKKLGMNVNKVAIYYARFGMYSSIRLDHPSLRGNFLESYLERIIDFA